MKITIPTTFYVPRLLLNALCLAVVLALTLVWAPFKMAYLASAVVTAAVFCSLWAYALKRQLVAPPVWFFDPIMLSVQISFFSALISHNTLFPVAGQLSDFVRVLLLFQWMSAFFLSVTVAIFLGIATKLFQAGDRAR